MIARTGSAPHVAHANRIARLAGEAAAAMLELQAALSEVTKVQLLDGVDVYSPCVTSLPDVVLSDLGALVIQARQHLSEVNTSRQKLVALQVGAYHLSTRPESLMRSPAQLLEASR